MPKEDFLHFIWKYRLIYPEYLWYRNRKVEILDPGIHNHSSGPDFFNARVRIGPTLWVGNVEIHIRASDWYRHGHQDDPAYDSVILHAVYDTDAEVKRVNGQEIPFIRINFNPSLLRNYEKLLLRTRERECYPYFKSLEKVYLRDWYGKLGMERIERKTGEISDILNENRNDWEETLYVMIASAFGMKLNREPFRLLARSVPLKTVLKYRKNRNTLNAIFYGQAGFLDELLSDDEYYASLQREYRSIKSTLPGPLVSRHFWKFMRSRPPGFPTVRIAQFANLIAGSFPLFGKLLEFRSLKELRESFEKGLENYWIFHFLYGKQGQRCSARPGKQTLDLIIINAVVPVILSYGRKRGSEGSIEFGISVLEQLPPENNEIIKNWNKFGISAENAFDSQALIQLETRYCRKQACLKCMVGQKLLLKINEEEDH